MKTRRRKLHLSLPVVLLLSLLLVGSAAAQDKVDPGIPAGTPASSASTLAVTDTSSLLYPLDASWSLVDFCTTGATGNRPAVPPDCHCNDDDSASMTLPFTFTFYGAPFTAGFINNNGNVSFGAYYSTYTATGPRAQGSSSSVLSRADDGPPAIPRCPATELTYER